MSTIAITVAPVAIQRGESVVVLTNGAYGNLVTAATLDGIACTILNAYVSGTSRATIATPPSVAAGSRSLVVTFSNGDTGSASLTVTVPSASRLYLCADATGNISSATDPLSVEKYPATEQAAATAAVAAIGAAAGVSSNVAKSQKGAAGAKNEANPQVVATALAYQRVIAGRFQSLPLAGISAIQAGTWKFRGVAKNFVTNSGFTGIPDKLAVYVWRPTGDGTGTIVGTIFDNTNDDTTRLCAARASTTKTSVAFNFSGAQVTGVAANDVLCVEWWSTYDTTVSLTNKTLQWFWGGLLDPGDTDNATFTDASNLGAATYVEAPTDLWTPAVVVSSISPATGSTAGGTAVTITGSGFTGATGATVGGVALTSFAVVNDTTVTGTTGAHAAGVVNVSVGSGTLGGAYTYGVPVTVTAVSPTTGPLAGGTAVTLTGTGFTSGATVRFGSTSATDVVVVDATTITCTAPTHAAGTVSVVAQVDGTDYTLSSAFTYAAATITAVDPVSGPTGGGTAVTVSGTQFAGVTSVTFGGTAATSVVTVSTTEITCTAPAHAAGSVAVAVTAGGTTATASGAYSYSADPPTLVTVFPAAGPASGGTQVTLTGTAFAAGATVTFGGVSATSVVVVSDTTITCVAPAHDPALVSVAVTVGSDTATKTSAFTYAAFTVNGLSPGSGSFLGGTQVTIAGTGFTAPVAVSFGGYPATDVLLLSPTAIACHSPPHAPGAVNVTVSSDGAVGTIASGFAYVGPSITDISPSSGSAVGGTSVLIIGQNFGPSATVQVGGAFATITSVTSTTITAVVPAHSAGAVDVVVTVGAESVTAAGAFTYTAVPVAEPVNAPDYAGYFLGTSSAVAQFETLELRHPALSQVYWFVRNKSDGLDANLENEAPYDGRLQHFDYLPMRLKFQGARDNLDFGIRVELGDVGEILPAEIDNVLASLE